MEPEFISLKDAAEQLKISEASVKARVLQGLYYGFVYVHCTGVFGEVDNPLPPWDEEFQFTRWRDFGTPLEESGRGVNLGHPDRRPRYEVTGWVVFDAVGEIFANGKSNLHQQWLGVLQFGEEPRLFHVLSHELGHYGVERGVTDTDVYLLNAQIELDRRKRMAPRTDDRSATVDLRKDARETYAAVIGALWLKAHGEGGAGRLSSDPYSAGASLATTLADLGISRPSADKIGRILADEVRGVGIKVGSSEREE